MVASPTGHGYLMVAQDGGIFSYGDVPFYGSLGQNPPAYPVVSVAAIGNPPPPPPPEVRVTKQVLVRTGVSDTWTSPPFHLDAGLSTLNYSCKGTGSYVGNCYYTLKDYATGRQVDYFSGQMPTDGVAYFHPEADGDYYLEVQLFASTSRSWSFQLTQEQCQANCQP
jgi:hypothetical protein